MEQRTCHCGGELMVMATMVVGREDIGVPIRLFICKSCKDILCELNQTEVEAITKTLAALNSDGFWATLETISDGLKAMSEERSSFRRGYTKELHKVLDKLENPKRKEAKSETLFAIDPIWWARRN